MLDGEGGARDEVRETKRGAWRCVEVKGHLQWDGRPWGEHCAFQARAERVVSRTERASKAHAQVAGRNGDCSAGCRACTVNLALTAASFCTRCLTTAGFFLTAAMCSAVSPCACAPAGVSIGGC
jgi:hypothetical protein